MFKLYEIDNLLSEAIDSAFAEREDGTISESWDTFINEVQLERDAKALQVAAYIKGVNAEAKAINAEEEALRARRKALEGRADNLKEYLGRIVQVGEKLSDSRTAIGWRKSTGIIIDDFTLIPDTCKKVTVEIMKTEVKKQLAEGTIPANAAHIEERQNISIK